MEKQNIIYFIQHFADIKKKIAKGIILNTLIVFIFLSTAEKSFAVKDNPETLCVPTVLYGNSGIFAQLLNIDNGTLIAKIPAKAPELKMKLNADTVQNRIKNFWSNSSQDLFFLMLEIKDKDQYIKIKIFNILGNEVLDVWDDKPKSADEEYEIVTNRLPNGIYICKVVGKSFHLNRKFIISR